ncbi:MAG TPA: endonuclease domain-containing protein [Chitinophagales bacterium]|nr:endonuclease domain-containing protein [Chitinophagales bacterium]
MARRLRKESTPGERKLWKEVLSNAKMLGYKFSRQRAIDNYIVDFFCKELMLVIEIDGLNHDHKLAEDKKRDERLEVLGYKTLRITHYMVMTDIVNVARMIEGRVTEIKQSGGLKSH